MDPSAVKINEENWCTGKDVPSAFRVLKVNEEDGEEVPVNAVDFLNEFTQELEKLNDENKSKIIENFYTAIPVQVSLLDDPNAIPQNADEDAVVDLWQVSHLAIQLQHEEALKAIIHFHTGHGIAALRTLVAGVNLDCYDAAQEEGEDGSEGTPSPPSRTKMTDLITCEVRSDWGGSVLMLGQYHGPSLAAAAQQQQQQSSGRSSSLPQDHHQDPASNSLNVSFKRGVNEEDPVASMHPPQNPHSEALEEQEDEFFFENSEFSVYQVTRLMAPVIRKAVHDLKEEQNKLFKTTPSPLLQFLRSYCASFVNLSSRPSIIIDSNLVFDSCEGDLAILSELFELLQGSLTPVIRGKKFPASMGPNTGNSVAASPVVPSLSTPISTPRGNTTGRLSTGAAAAGSPIRNSPFWFTCAPQESQRIAFYATWMTFREQTSEKPGSARVRRAAEIINEYRITLNSHKKMRDAKYIPSAAIWSGHMFIISKLISKDCSVEDFMDIVGEGAYLSVLSSNGIPGIVVAVLTACVSALSLVVSGEATCLRLLTKKVETMLNDAPNRPSALRAYILSPIQSHTERFEELWFNDTPFSEAKKFKTRVEMMYCCTTELVLAVAENHWDSTRTPAEPISTALSAWVSLWKGFFFNVKERPMSMHRRSASRTSVGLVPMSSVGGSNMSSLREDTPRTSNIQNSPSMKPKDPPSSTTIGGSNNNNTNNNAGATAALPGETPEVDEQQEALKHVCEALPLRLQHGRDPLPWLKEVLFPPSSTPGAATTSSSGAGTEGGDGGTPKRTAGAASTSLPASSVDSEFHDAQEAFGKLYASKASNEIKLKFYGLFKQATVGDVNISRPWLMDQVGRAKWDAWDKLKGMTPLDAKRMYITEFKILEHTSGSGNSK